MTLGLWLKSHQVSSRSQDYPWHVRAIQELLPLIQVTEARRVVDLGSGEPPSTLQVMMKTVGVDIVSVDLQASTDVRAELAYLPFQSSTFGLAIARHSLEHCPAPLIALREMARVAPWCLVVVPEMALVWQYWQGHYSVFPRSVWERLFRIAGLKVVFFDEGDFTEPNATAQRIEWRWLLRRDTDTEGPFEPNGHYLGPYTPLARQGWQE